MGDTGDLNAAIVLRPFAHADDAVLSTWFTDAGELRSFAGRSLVWPPDSEQWQRLRNDAAVSAWTALLPDTTAPVGHGELVDIGGSSFNVERVAVDPQHRGQGLGSAITAELVALAGARGYREVGVWISPDNVTGVRGYGSVGFRKSRELNGRGLMRMTLGLASGGSTASVSSATA